MNAEMRERMANGKGFVAALDQSGGSTPKALRLYGIDESAYSGDEEMFDLVHEMRTRIMTSPSFTGEKILATILFEQTMDREVEGRPTADYLWQEKGIVPILKVDKGLAEIADGVQMMKPMPALDETLARAVSKNIFGTKMRSVIKENDAAGIAANVAQQFETAERILAAGLVPIIEPEVDIHAEGRAAIEETLSAELKAGLEALPEGQQVMFKLTIPEVDGFYSDLIAHPKVLRVVALSGGFTRADADERLARNSGLIASFSRALTEGLSVDQSEDDFDALLAESIDAIYRASNT